MNDNKIPTILITGFLGSGKTTFINWMLAKHADKKISVILNEFGDCKLESKFIKNSNGEVVELANGCLCCVARVDVPRVVQYIKDHAPGTEYLFIEASGLSDPEIVCAMLRNLTSYGMIHYDSNLCIVDAVNFDAMRSDHPIILSQLGDSDLILITKSREAGFAQTERVRKFIENLLDHATILVFEETMPSDFFLEPHTGNLSPEGQGGDQTHGNHHGHNAMHTLWFTGNISLSFDRLSDLLSHLPKEIIRVKGFAEIIHNNGSKENILIQYVGSRSEFLPFKPNGTENVKNAVLFVGTEFDDTAIMRSMEACEIRRVS